MATFIKGNAVANATSYELLEKTAEGAYTSLEEKNEINFEVSAMSFAPGNHTLVVKAKADGYETSDPSNEVVYTVEDNTPTETTWYVDFTDEVATAAIAYNNGGVTFVQADTNNKYTGVPINAIKLKVGLDGPMGYGKVASDGDTFTHLGVINLTGASTEGASAEVQTFKLEETIELAEGERFGILEYNSAYTGKIWVAQYDVDEAAKARISIRGADSSVDVEFALPLAIGYIAD